MSDVPKLATASAAFGTMAGVQFSGVRHWLSIGLEVQVDRTLPCTVSDTTATISPSINSRTPECIFRVVKVKAATPRSRQTCLDLEEGNHIVRYRVTRTNAWLAVPTVPITKGVHAPGNREVLIIRPKVESIALETANHGYELVIGGWVIPIAVDHVDGFEAVHRLRRLHRFNPASATFV